MSKRKITKRMGTKHSKTNKRFKKRRVGLERKISVVSFVAGKKLYTKLYKVADTNALVLVGCLFTTAVLGGNGGKQLLPPLGLVGRG